MRKSCENQQINPDFLGIYGVGESKKEYLCGINTNLIN